MLGKLNKRNVWAQILVFVLLFAMLPTAALAEEVATQQEEIIVDGITTQFPVSDDLEAGKTYLIQLDADVEMQGDLDIPKNTSVTLDLNGHTLTVDQDDENFNFGIYNHGSFYIQDSGSEGTLAVTKEYSIYNAGRLYVTGGILGERVDGKDAAEWGLIVPLGSSDITINGGQILGGIDTTGELWAGTSVLTILKGRVEGEIYMSSGTATIRGGTFQKDILTDTLNISGGIFEGSVRTWGLEDITITGGSFKVLSEVFPVGAVDQDQYDIVLGTDDYYHVLPRDTGMVAPASPSIGVEFDTQGAATVTLSASDENVEIWYSADYPYTEYMYYQDPFSASEWQTVYAYTQLYDDTYHKSILSKFACRAIYFVETPQAAPAPGSYQNSVQVTLTAGEDAEILYTTNGEYPSLTAANGTKTYDGPFTLTASATVNAIACQDGNFSELLTAVYTITSESGGGSDDSGSSGGGSSSGGSNQSSTTTTKNPDGSTTTTTTDKATGTVTAVTTGKDGTVTTVETKKDGTVTKTMKADGMTSTVVTDKDGTITKAEVHIGSVTANQTVLLPVGVPVVSNLTFAPKLEIYLADTGSDVKVTIPVKNATTSTVAVLVVADGSEKIVPASVVTAEGVVLPLSGSATVKVVDNSKNFTDVPASSWAADSVAFVTSRELFNGTGAETFTPDAPMTREMLMTVLARLDGADTSVSPLAQGMAWATEKGISDGSNPGGSISREQLATMLYRYAGSPAVSGGLTGFHDAGSVSSYAQAAMQWAVASGIITGTGDGSLAPLGEASRAQVAAMLQRYIVGLNG